MIKLDLLVGVVSFALLVFCLVEVISTPESRIRNLPKVAWVLLVLLFPLVGSIAWLVAGRPETNAPRSSTGAAPGFPEYERPGRAAPADAAKDEEFLRQVRERAEQQRRAHDLARRERERLAEEERERFRKGRREGDAPEQP
ncbi:PLDc N-terminal domain-containing protein [Nocardioides sp. KIGAM211]|uniref:PLDc N-terminal domain-containing protein n=1 Tax=Nocardioides luti TaxID=2761101 RepID=A0A7X0VBL4_9ACTN|nr:PLDc N-terminal domain-containing protein [Nocardioides luti]